MTSRATLAVVLAALAVSTTACSSPSDIAFERATEQARANVERARGRLESSVGAGKNEADALTTADLNPDRVMGKRATSDGFEVDAVFYGDGEAGGAGTYVGVNVRLCARLTVRQRPSPKVDLSDTDCPSSLPDNVYGYGPIDRTVRLKD